MPRNPVPFPIDPFSTAVLYRTEEIDGGPTSLNGIGLTYQIKDTGGTIVAFTNTQLLAASICDALNSTTINQRG